MSDIDPGGWQQASDGRWFPPDVALPPGLTRMPDGSTVLEGLDLEPTPPEPLSRMERRRRAELAERAAAEAAAADAAIPEPAPSRIGEVGQLGDDGDDGDDDVGGPIHPRPTIYFGRPPGTENRRAGGAALVGSMFLLLAAVAPWATRHPGHLDPSSVGWSDANGDLGSGWLALVVGLAALGLAASALAGRVDAWMKVADGVAGAAAVLLAVVEGFRIRRAGTVVDDLTAGLVELRPSWGLLCIVAGGVSLAVAAAVHNTEVPAWKRN